MRAKWYFGALLIIITALGIYQNQISEPNQEIVLQFTDATITSAETESAIVVVKEQLHAIGVRHINVQELQDGQIKISYYSAANVASVKRLLSVNENLKLNYASNGQISKTSDLPTEKDSKNYNLNVYEIQKTSNTGWDLDGKCVLTAKQDLDRFYNPNVYFYSNNVNAHGANKISEEAIKVFKNIAIAIDNTLGNIPEGRAGPIA
ncbi:hypothetical protein [Gaetbulibacter saemankumensis]|uniref:hypothetical protein n=1 Tax=Gaetbulibacter saemankumensis TaxID=311208 RepID=UPI00041FDD15|nr:hypothetical protein [Gaetbulibacter saemankumensis]